MPLKELKSASSLQDIAFLLGFSASTLAFVLYKLPNDKKYKTFDIPKKSGGVRQISAPEDRLKTLQRNLATLLYQCCTEIEGTKKPTKSLSHGFRKGHSIITNARQHKNRRYVLNLDIKDFFPSFNFGRVRGFFIKNHDFALNEKIATIIAQIACFNNALPQGSPCSPIISELIAHLLDVRLAQLAKHHKCTYSRYADDITFSTNQKIFPSALAHRTEEPASDWVLGDDLLKQISKVGFSVNGNKTRMQCATGRQIVTGLTVNKKVNIRADYYRSARSLCNALFGTGAYQLPGSPHKTSKLSKIEGILNHIHYVKDSGDKRTADEKKQGPSGARKLYKKLLFYKYFVALDKPLVICEGKTDSIYLKAAIRHLPIFHPKLAEIVGKSTKQKIAFFRYSALSDHVLRLGGGAGGIKNFISHYVLAAAKYKHATMNHPVILLVDNDDGVKGIFSIIKSIFKVSITLTSDASFYHLHRNLYLVKTPALHVPGISCIEDFFDAKMLNAKLGDKTFNPKDDHDSSKEYGKAAFAEHVIRANAATIDFSRFTSILNRIVAVIDDYKPPAV